jgi:dTDP-glucose 4,6-dehydratase
MIKNILVTGGAGFIGSHFIKHLVKNFPSYKIVNVDKLTYAGSKRNVENLPITNMWYVDIRDESIKDILGDYKIDTIINFAAESHVDRSVKYPKEFIETEILGLFNLVYQSIKNKNITLMVHVSTDEVYGDKYLNEADELFKLDPNSPYASSKACADLLLQSYIKTYDFPAIIVRPCNNYGPNQYPEKLIPMTITRVLNNQEVLVHGRGIEKREWIYVEDCCRAIEAAMHHGKIGEIYNIGSRIRFNNIYVIAAIIKMLKGKDNIMDFVKVMPNRPGNDIRYAINSDKIKTICNDYVKTEFLEGLKTTIEWYKTNWHYWSSIDLDSNIYDNENYLR